MWSADKPNKNGAPIYDAPPERDEGNLLLAHHLNLLFRFLTGDIGTVADYDDCFVGWASFNDFAFLVGAAHNEILGC
jgi:hypothetical protein